MTHPDGNPLGAARAAYRLGLIECMLHPDTQAAMDLPGIFVESIKGEREHRLAELADAGIDPDDALADIRLAEPRTRRGRAQKAKS